jgi:hypothetical protein
MNSPMTERSSTREVGRENVTPLKRREAAHPEAETRRGGRAKWVVVGLLLVVGVAAGAFVIRGRRAAADDEPRGGRDAVRG